MIWRNRKLYNYYPLVKSLEPAPLHPQALDGDERLRAWKRILHQIACGIADFVDFLLGEDVEIMVGARFPQHLSSAASPAPECSTVCSALRVCDTGRDLIRARHWRCKSADSGRSLRDQHTRRNLQPGAHIMRQVGVPSPFHLGGFDLQLHYVHPYLRPGHRSAVLVDHQYLELRWRASCQQPVLLPQAYIAVAPSVLSRSVPGDRLATVVAYSTLHAQLTVEHLGCRHSKRRLQGASVVQTVLSFMERLTGDICIRIRIALGGVGVCIAFGIGLAASGLHGCVGRSRGSSDGEIKTSGLSLLCDQGASLHTGVQAYLSRAIGPTGVEFRLRSDRHRRLWHDERLD